MHGRNIIIYSAPRSCTRAALQQDRCLRGEGGFYTPRPHRQTTCKTTAADNIKTYWTNMCRTFVTPQYVLKCEPRNRYYVLCLTHIMNKPTFHKYNINHNDIHHFSLELISNSSYNTSTIQDVHTRAAHGYIGTVTGLSEVYFRDTL